MPRPLVRLNLQPRQRKTLSDFSPFDPAIESAWSIVQGQAPDGHVREGRSVREQGFEVNAIVGACIRAIASQIAAVPLEAYTKTKQNVTPLPDSEYQLLLDQPAPQCPGFTYRHVTAGHFVTYGNFYVQLIRRGNRPGAIVEGLRIVHPERLRQVFIDNDTGAILRYVWNDHIGRQRITDWVDMIHGRDLSVDPDGWFGFPRGVAALGGMLTDTDATSYVRQVLGNSGIPALIVMAEAGWQEDELRKQEARWHERMSQRGERGRTRFLSGITKVEVVGHSLKDLEFLPLRQIGREDICAAFGVDPRLVGAGSAKGSEGGLSGQQYEEARRKFEQMTCAPIRAAVVDAHDGVLSPEFGFEYVRFQPAALKALVETPKEVADRLSVHSKAGHITLEEVRAELGLPEQMNPAHHITNGTTIVPVARLDETPEPPAVAPAAVPARIAPVPARRRLSDGSRSLRARGAALTHEQRLVIWQAFDAKARALEPKFASLAARLLLNEGETVVRLLADTRRAPVTRVTKTTDQFYADLLAQIERLYADDAEFRQAWDTAYGPIIAETVTQAGAALAADLGVSFDLANPRVFAAIGERVTMLSGHVAQTTVDQLRVVLSAGRAAGQDATEIAKVIQATIYNPAITGPRAQLIAENETAAALNEGEWLAATQDDVMQSKAWMSQSDGLVRDTHVVCETEGWIPIQQEFSNGCLYPHDRNGAAAEVIRCRCALLFSDLTAPEAAATEPDGTGNVNP